MRARVRALWRLIGVLASAARDYPRRIRSPTRLCSDTRGKNGRRLQRRAKRNGGEIATKSGARRSQNERQLAADDRRLWRATTCCLQLDIERSCFLFTIIVFSCVQMRFSSFAIIFVVDQELLALKLSVAAGQKNFGRRSIVIIAAAGSRSRCRRRDDRRALLRRHAAMARGHTPTVQCESTIAPTSRRLDSIVASILVFLCAGMAAI